MFSKMTKILMLSASLLMAGTGAASAVERNVAAPVFAGAAVSASVDAAPSTLIARNDRHDNRHYDRRPPPREYRQYHHPSVRYVPVRPRYDHRRYAPPPRHHYRHDYHDRRRG